MYPASDCTSIALAMLRITCSQHNILLFCSGGQNPSRSKEIVYHTDVRPISLGGIDDLDWVRPGGCLRHVEIDRCRASSRHRKGFPISKRPRNGGQTPHCTGSWTAGAERCAWIVDCGCQRLWCRLDANNEGSAARETTLER